MGKLASNELAWILGKILDNDATATTPTSTAVGVMALLGEESNNDMVGNSFEV